ncbi:hypothetical protein EDB81DRAFT_3019 [Dactylonectria macrodidyma]|uniref:Uncharacterized protein n=1 Tax=Dactylonectria macrodidyma TaxID=307937 RepID=A0A9P9FU14_9HYPO|nr:hypothetical protein EDB81DRAFT_3019 [Dactylonectria macrodidyma]
MTGMTLKTAVHEPDNGLTDKSSVTEQPDEEAVVGTAILAMVWDLSHVRIGNIVGCQLLKGVENGYCAVVTTVSTLVLELSSLERKHTYIYGATSFFVSFGFMVNVAGSLQWTQGLETCTSRF